LRSEMAKVMHVKTASVRRSVDSTSSKFFQSWPHFLFDLTCTFSVSAPGVSLDTTQSLSVLLDGDDSQALKHKVLELQKENSTLRVSNAKLGRRITVALTSAALSEKQAVAADDHDVSFSAEDALLAHHQSEIAAAEAAVTISSLKREVRELRSKNLELQQHIDSTGSSVSDVEWQFRDATARLAEYQSLYVESDRRNQEMLEQVSKEQLRHRQLEVSMVSMTTAAQKHCALLIFRQVGLQRDIAESRDRNHALEELVRQLRSAIDQASAEHQRSMQNPL
jgi:hypothetical protein